MPYFKRPFLVTFFVSYPLVVLVVQRMQEAGRLERMDLWTLHLLATGVAIAAAALVTLALWMVARLRRKSRVDRIGTRERGEMRCRASVSR